MVKTRSSSWLTLWMVLSTFCGACLGDRASSDTRLGLPPHFSEGAVLRSDGARLWGRAAPLASVSVACSSGLCSGSGDDQLRVRGKIDGTWSLTIYHPISVAPVLLNVTSTSDGAVEEISTSVLFGHVWLCSGQSNMV